MSKKRRLAYIALIANALIWGAALPIVKPALDTLSPLQFLFARFALAAPLSLPFLFFVSRASFTLIKRHFVKILALEFVGTPILLAILYSGLAKTSAIEASLIGATSPIFTILGGVIFLKEKETKRELRGLGIALAGTMLLALEPVISSSSTLTLSHFSGNMLIVLQNVLWAAYLIIAKRLYKGISKLALSALSYWIGLVSFASYLFFTSSLPPLSLFASPAIIFPVLYMALPGGIIALALYLYGQDKIEASEASLFTYIHGAVALPAAYFLLRELPSPIEVIAALVIVLGVLLAEHKYR